MNSIRGRMRQMMEEMERQENNPRAAQAQEVQSSMWGDEGTQSDHWPAEPEPSANRSVSVKSGAATSDDHSGQGANRNKTNEEAVDAANASLLSKLQECKLRAFNPDCLKVNEQANRLIHTKSTWQELHVPAAITRGLVLNGFDTPSLIQSVALDILFQGKNLIAQSQSGTGKTVAFVIGMLHHIKPDQPYTQALVLEPTFELAKQTAMVIRNIVAKGMNVTVTEAVKGQRPAAGQIIQEQIVVGTPGTVLDWLNKFKVIDAKKIKFFVLDEADVMIAQQGHQDQSVRIFKMMDQGAVQTALFSATYDPKVMDFAKQIIRQPELITVKNEDLSLENIHQYYVKIGGDEDKIKALRNLYGMVTVDNAIVFCRSREWAHRIYEALRPDGHPIGILAGDMDVNQRTEAIERFRDGRDRLLITTNVTARGIDVMSVNLVVNFDLPLTQDHKPDFETYIHRIGRTGRFGRGGLAINFVRDDRDMTTIHAFEKYFQREIKPLDQENDAQMNQLNQQATGD